MRRMTLWTKLNAEKAGVGGLLDRMGGRQERNPMVPMGEVSEQRNRHRT